SGPIQPDPGLDGMRRDDTPCPLSFMQEGMWFYDRLRPGTALYNIPIYLAFGDPPDAGAVQGALDFLLARHDALRTRFDLAAGEPVQLADDTLRVGLTRYEYDPADPRHAAASRAIEREIRRPFDLRRGPPLRAALVRVAAKEHVLILVLHHIAGDGRSTEIILDDFKRAYDTLATGGRPSPPWRVRPHTQFVRGRGAARS